MVDAATERETRARETIQSLKLEIANLTKLVEQGAGLSMGQEHRFVCDTKCIIRPLKFEFDCTTVKQKK